jgi:hypothetical protein
MLTRSYPRHFAFYVADPISSIDTRSLAMFAAKLYFACAFEDENKAPSRPLPLRQLRRAVS